MWSAAIASEENKTMEIAMNAKWEGAIWCSKRKFKVKSQTNAMQMLLLRWFNLLDCILTWTIYRI
jgi:hypothetical protein